MKGMVETFNGADKGDWKFGGSTLSEEASTQRPPSPRKLTHNQVPPPIEEHPNGTSESGIVSEQRVNRRVSQSSTSSHAESETHEELAQSSVKKSVNIGESRHDEDERDTRETNDSTNDEGSDASDDDDDDEDDEDDEEEVMSLASSLGLDVGELSDLSELASEGTSYHNPIFNLNSKHSNPIPQPNSQPSN